MKKRFEHIYQCGWGCLLLLLVVGCQRGELTQAEGREEIFTLHCVPWDMEGEASTRAAATENTVEDYAVLIFKKAGGGTPAENILVKKVIAADVNGVIDFSIAQDETEHYLYVVGNSQGKLVSLKENISTQQDFLDIRVSNLNADGNLPAAPFGMCSQKITLSKLSYEEFRKVNGGNTVKLEKNVAKFRVRFSVPVETFRPVSVEYKQMCNYGYLAKASVGPSVRAEDYVPDMKLLNGAWTTPVYVYEQHCSVRDEDWKSPGFSLILSGYYKGNNTLSYYRFALPTPESTFADIERNVSYELNVIDIRNAGHLTYEEAVKSPFLNDVAAKIMPNMDGLQDMREIYTNGFYELGLEASVAWIYRSYTGQTYSQPICTVITKTLDASVVDTELKLVHGTGQNDFELKSDSNDPGKYVLSYCVRNPNTGNTTVDRDGYHTATLIFGTLRKVVKVKTEDGLSGGQSSHVLKFKCSNGRVLVDNWTKEDWCGLGPNSTYDVSRYYGEIMNSANENIFIHVRPGGTIYTPRIVELVGRSNMIRVFLWKKN